MASEQAKSSEKCRDVRMRWSSDRSAYRCVDGVSIAVSEDVPSGVLYWYAEGESQVVLLVSAVQYTRNLACIVE